MAVLIDIECDECKLHIDDGEPVYCEDCYKRLEDEKDRLLNENEDLRARVEELEREVAEK